ncbi:MAG: hypothetical protein NC342_09010 [Pseudoflavonifractor sp.]|nr:hypothetical protein [Alloprevotella sp.]MCM1117660.1 hypothetical protein [Pseudoflavonifractor sp.]
MKKTILLFVVAAVVCFLSIAAYSGRVRQASEGFRAPEISLQPLSGQSSRLSLKDLKGRYVLLSFWSAADPTSRMRNMTYDGIVHDIDAGLAPTQEPVSFISVNFDTSRKLLEEIASRDGLDPTMMAHAQGIEAKRLIADYRLADGYRSYLIGPTGHVMARNPSKADIMAALRR